MESDTEDNSENNLNTENTITENDNGLDTKFGEMDKNTKDSERSVLRDSEYIEESTDISRIGEGYSTNINKDNENNDEGTLTNEDDENNEIELGIKEEDEIIKEDEEEIIKDNEEEIIKKDEEEIIKEDEEEIIKKDEEDIIKEDEGEIMKEDEEEIMKEDEEDIIKEDEEDIIKEYEGEIMKEDEEEIMKEDEEEIMKEDEEEIIKEDEEEITKEDEEEMIKEDEEEIIKEDEGEIIKEYEGEIMKEDEEEITKDEEEIMKEDEEEIIKEDEEEIMKEDEEEIIKGEEKIIKESEEELIKRREIDVEIEESNEEEFNKIKEENSDRLKEHYESREINKDDLNFNENETKRSQKNKKEREEDIKQIRGKNVIEYNAEDDSNNTEREITSAVEDNERMLVDIVNDAETNEKDSENVTFNEIEHEEFNVNKANQINEEEGSFLDSRDISKDTTEKVEDYKDLRNIGVSNFFTVPIQLDDGSVKNQLITIIKSKSKKPFLGGYRHKLSEKEYHHAAVQTFPKPRLPPKVQLFSRDTQTFQLKHRKINTENTTSTQMNKPGVYVSNVTDRLVQIKPYETADEYQERMLGNVVTIQKYYRRWLAQQVVEEKRKQRDDRLLWEQNDKELKEKEKGHRIENEYKKRMHPKTKADFDLLYSDLERWREEQLNDIENSDFTKAEKKAKKALLLEEETDLLAAIDRHKIDRKGEAKIESVQKLLSKAASPKSWKDPKGRKIEMDTQFTIRSRELLEIFNSLNMQYLTSDERLDVLLTLKHTVKEHDCKLTKEIVELVNREADLIMRNMKDASLVGLRKRISTLFLQYCKTPTFNPQISLLLKVPPDPMVLVGDINYCKYCGRYLRSTEFSLSTKSSKLTICKSCARKDNQSRNRQDYSHYRRILKEIQMMEQQDHDQSKVAFIFKQNDVKSLIESVWDGKSILSGCDDLDELVFLRWDRKEHWSPWNTIFITKDEAEAHLKVTDLCDTYSKVLMNRVVQKHVIAKNIFGSLEKMVETFQSKSSKLTMKV